MIGPGLLLVVGLSVLPAIWTAIQAFFRVNPLDPPVRWTGLGNFQQTLTNPQVIQSWVNTGLYLVIGVGLSTVLGIAMALLLQRKFRFRSIVIAVMILPWALPGVVEGVIWKWIYDPNSGVLNSILQSMHIINSYQVWISDNRLLTIFLIELVQVWQMTPLSALLILAALQLIPRDVYEAATIDGCGRWRSIWLITLPLARAGIAVAMVQSVIQALNIFDQPYILNGASTTGTSVLLQTYFISFQDLDFGNGYALSLIITIVTVLLSILILKVVYRRVEME